jgi:hypothetical protein
MQSLAENPAWSPVGKQELSWGLCGGGKALGACMGGLCFRVWAGAFRGHVWSVNTPELESWSPALGTLYLCTN